MTALKLMLDTNIVVDIISRRDGYEDSLNVLRCCEIGKANGFVSAITVTDCMYILRKHISPQAVRGAMQTLLSILDVADVLKNDITAAFVSNITDYEDAVQALCAARENADYIVTRNLKDFTKSKITAISPTTALEIIRKQ